MTQFQHVARVLILMLLAGVLLGVVAARTDVLYADGLRYVAQAQRIERGEWRQALVGSIDQPVYPLAIATIHRILGGTGPESWQAAAQVASVIAGVLLVVPLYLVAFELFGGGAAWLAVFLFYAAPLTPHLLADVLSEGTFLLFWTWGLWFALRFLREGAFVWLPLLVVASGLAYLTRPEGVLLPAALVLTLLLVPCLRSTRLNWPRWWAAVVLLVIGPLIVLGPYVASKGGIASKPAVARLLGTAPRSAADAVERAEPLDPAQTELQTHLKAIKVVFEAVRDAATPWLLPFSVLGFVSAFRPLAARSRVSLFIGLLVAITLFALIRLFVTGGYCTPRHVVVVAMLVCASAAHGLERLLGMVSIPGRRLGLAEGRFAAGPAVWAVVLGLYVAWGAPSIAARVNRPMEGYREAGAWLEAHVSPEARVADATGWALFYGERQGYTFATLRESAKDQDLRWVVAREAHLVGPWWYCAVMRELVGAREPVAAFPERQDKGQARVLVFDLSQPETAHVSWQLKNERRSR